MFLFNGKTLVNTSKILASVIYLEFLGITLMECINEYIFDSEINPE